MSNNILLILLSLVIALVVVTAATLGIISSQSLKSQALPTYPLPPPLTGAGPGEAASQLGTLFTQADVLRCLGMGTAEGTRTFSSQAIPTNDTGATLINEGLNACVKGAQAIARRKLTCGTGCEAVTRLTNFEAKTLDQHVDPQGRPKPPFVEYTCTARALCLPTWAVTKPVQPILQ